MVYIYKFQDSAVGFPFFVAKIILKYYLTVLYVVEY